MKIMSLNHSIILFIFVLSYTNSWASSENKICKEYPKYVTKFSYKQLCEYGKDGCNNIPERNQYQVLCDSEDNATCYIQKNWQTIEQYMNLPQNTKITNIITNISNINGITTSLICVNSKPKLIMTKEKFLTYQELTPTILDGINIQIKKMLTCFEKDKSYQNINSCSQQKKKTIEAVIRGLIPDQKEKLCAIDANNELHFQWNEQNYEILLSELKKRIIENEKNKKCIQTSQSFEEYAKCLSAK